MPKVSPAASTPCRVPTTAPTTRTRRRLPAPPPKPTNKPRTRAQQRSLGTWIVGGLLLVFVVAVFWLAPDELPAFKQRLLAILAALLAGVFAYFLTGDMGLELDAIETRFGKGGVKATGGIAVFALVLVWWLSPLAPVGTGKQDGDAPTQPGPASAGAGIANTGEQTIKGPVTITGNNDAPPETAPEKPGAAAVGTGVANTGTQVIDGPVTIGGPSGEQKE